MLGIGELESTLETLLEVDATFLLIPLSEMGHRTYF